MTITDHPRTPETVRAFARLVAWKQEDRDCDSPAQRKILAARATQALLDYSHGRVGVFTAGPQLAAARLIELAATGAAVVAADLAALTCHSGLGMVATECFTFPVFGTPGGGFGIDWDPEGVPGHATTAVRMLGAALNNDHRQAEQLAKIAYDSSGTRELGCVVAHLAEIGAHLLTGCAGGDDRG